MGAQRRSIWYAVCGLDKERGHCNLEDGQLYGRVISRYSQGTLQLEISNKTEHSSIGTEDNMSRSHSSEGYESDDWSDTLEEMEDDISIPHIPGVTDKMSGALWTWPPPSKIPIDDELDCSTDTNAQFVHMPWRILTSKSLAEVPGLFNDPYASMHILGDDFLTTNAGLYRAYRECEHTQLTGRDRDYLMIAALAKRGGTVPFDHDGRYAVYPEQIIPFADPSSLDTLYWMTLFARGAFWEDCGAT